jgi:uncharacterized protein (TIGR02246 family)
MYRHGKRIRPISRSPLAAALLLLVGVTIIGGPVVQAQKPKSGARPPAGVGTLSAEDDKATRKVVAGFMDGWNAHDMKAIARLLRDDAEWVNVVGMHWRGREAVMAATTAFHETMFKDNHVVTDAVELRAIGAGYAIAVITMTVDSFTTPDGHVMPKAQNRETMVLVKGPDGWKIAHGHNTIVDANAAKNDPVNAPREKRPLQPAD